VAPLILPSSLGNPAAEKNPGQDDHKVHRRMALHPRHHSSHPESLFEAELFGYKGGAFTGSMRGGRSGCLKWLREDAVLDEVGIFL